MKRQQVDQRLKEEINNREEKETLLEEEIIRASGEKMGRPLEKHG